MSLQLALPASWAQNFIGLRDPRDKLDGLRQDVMDAKHAIRFKADFSFGCWIYRREFFLLHRNPTGPTAGQMLASTAS
jgi:hypothetical protein